MKQIVIAVFLLSACARVRAQEEFVDPPSRELTTIPFTQYTGGVIVFKALLGNFKDSLNFVLDSGSGGISLDSSTAAELGLKPTEPERMIRGIGGMKKVGLLKNRTLKINHLVIDSLNFHVIDYEILSSLYGEKIDGIVGYAVLSRYIVKINYETRMLSFWSNGTIKYPKGGYTMLPRISSLPFLPSTVKDAVTRRFNYLIDIGAGLTVLFSQDYIDDSVFLKNNRKKYLKQAEGLGGKVNIYLTVMKELRIGPYRFRNVPVNIFDDTYNVTSYPVLGGLIGNDIFRRFNCIINYKSRQIHLMPNKFFQDPFDYAYTGIELYLINGKALIGDIPKGSPADKAGLKAGDEVMFINNRLGATLDELKQALQSAYGTIKVIVKRNGELIETKMKVINIVTGKTITNQILTNTFRDGIRIRTSNGEGLFRREDP